MHVEEVQGTLVVVHLPVPILDAEWDALMTRLREGDHTGVVIVANNHPPSSLQRNAARDAVTQRTKPAANVSILSDALVIRTVVSIINLFVGDLVRMFSPHDMQGAFAHAKVKSVPDVSAAIARMKNTPGR
jgi:hypothetical protein